MVKRKLFDNKSRKGWYYVFPEHRKTMGYTPVYKEIEGINRGRMEEYAKERAQGRKITAKKYHQERETMGGLKPATIIPISKPKRKKIEKEAKRSMLPKPEKKLFRAEKADTRPMFPRRRDDDELQLAETLSKGRTEGTFNLDEMAANEGKVIEHILSPLLTQEPSRRQALLDVLKLSANQEKLKLNYYYEIEVMGFDRDKVDERQEVRVGWIKHNGITIRELVQLYSNQQGLRKGDIITSDIFERTLNLLKSRGATDGEKVFTPETITTRVVVKMEFTTGA